jgi:hypothetical protein
VVVVVWVQVPEPLVQVQGDINTSSSSCKEYEEAMVLLLVMA